MVQTENDKHLPIPESGITTEPIAGPVQKRDKGLRLNRIRGLVIGAATGSSIGFGILWISRCFPIGHIQVFLNNAPRDVSVALVLLAVCLWLAPKVWSGLCRWGHRRSVLPVDVGLVGLCFGASTALWLRPIDVGWSAIIGTFVISTAIALIARTCIARTTRPPDMKGEPGAELFDAALGADGFGPLTDFARDELGRTPLLLALSALLTYPGTSGLTIGLNGAWGSGKTSLLFEIERRLALRGAITVRLDAWNYREPGQVVEAYFTSLSGAIRRWTYLPGLTQGLMRLAEGLAALGGSRPHGLFRAFKWTSNEGLDVIRNDVSAALRALDRPVVVFVDDLDRLDAAELGAALRAIRLLSGMQVTHVLAYDGAQLSRILFPQAVTTHVARDYLGKLVNLEIPLAQPREEVRLAFLEATLNPVLNDVGPDEARQFVDHLQAVSPRLIAQILDTPREIRRVIVETTWKWKQLTPHVNLFDLYLLTLIQHRFPQIYRDMHRHPEYFTRAQWSSNLATVFKATEYEKHAQEYVEQLRSSGDPDELEAANLLAGFERARLWGNATDEAESRSQRRLIHPDIFPRYFQLGLLATDVTENSVEDFARQLLKHRDGESRQLFIVETLREAISADRVRGFLDQWGIVDTATERSTNDILFADIALGFGLVMAELSGGDEDFFSPKTTGYSIVRRALAKTHNDGFATEIAIRVIETCSDLGLAGDLVFYAGDAEPHRREAAFGKRKIDPIQIRVALERTLARRLEDTGPLVDNEDALVPVVYRISPTLSTKYILRDLKKSPRSLPKLLGLAVKLHASAFQSTGYEVTFNDLGELMAHVDLFSVDDATSSAAPETWTDPHDAALVRFFREWVARERTASGAAADNARGRVR